MDIVFNMNWIRLLKPALTFKWRLKQVTVSNISLFIKGEATEFGISHFSGSFLGPQMTLKKKNAGLDSKDFYPEHPEAISSQIQKSESWEAKQEF